MEMERRVKMLSLDYSNCHDIPLDALVRRITREVKIIFKKEGDLWPPLWFVETPEGMIIFGTPIHEREYKPVLAKNMTSYFQEINARRYVAVAPCWRHGEDGKRESLHIIAHDGKQILSAFCDIVRPMGGKPYLTKFNDLELPELSEDSVFNVQLPVRIEH